MDTTKTKLPYRRWRRADPSHLLRDRLLAFVGERFPLNLAAI